MPFKDLNNFSIGLKISIFTSDNLALIHELAITSLSTLFVSSSKHKGSYLIAGRNNQTLVWNKNKRIINRRPVFVFQILSSQSR